jgi:glycosyltransferase involved in cell wall biosynthesis
MRIGIDIKAFKNGSTGIARYLKNLMDELQEIDNTNEYILFSCSESSYEIVNKKWKKVIVSWKLPGVIWQQLVLPFQLLKYSIDVVWAPEQIAPVLTFGKTKVITTVHDLAALRFPESCQKSNLIIQKVLFSQSLKRSSAILPVSSFIKSELNDRYIFLKNSILQVVTNAGPDWELLIKECAPERENYLLCVGNIEPRKNLIRLLKAFEIVNDSELRLVMVGPKGWKNSVFFDTLESNSKKDRIEIKGFVSEQELKHHYLHCKALVYPSLYEGFGIPVLEAFSMNCPVLTSKGTVMEEIAGDAAIYFDPLNIYSISSAINNFLKRQVDCLGEINGVYEKFKSFYSWKNSAFQLKTIFEKFK